MCHFFSPIAIKRAWSDQVKYIPRYEFFWHLYLRDTYPLQPYSMPLRHHSCFSPWKCVSNLQGTCQNCRPAPEPSRILPAAHQFSVAWGMSGEDWGPVLSTVPKCELNLSNSSMQNLLIAGIYPPHLLREKWVLQGRRMKTSDCWSVFLESYYLFSQGWSSREDTKTF